jgi:hypothetical protein
MVIKTQSNARISGLIPHLIPNGVAILQYVDDTIMCLENDMEKARNVKLLLYIFEHMSGLKINFEKSELIMVGGDNGLANEYAEVFNCQVGLFPIKYLGAPVSPSRLKVADWLKLEEKHAKKLEVWQGNSLSMGGRTMLINSNLSNTETYHMVCKSKKKGGLGMKKLRKMNISLLCKWWWMLEEEEGALARDCEEKVC